MKRWSVYLVIAVAFVIQMMVVLPSGSHYCYDNTCGVYFWGAHEHDGIWHLALVNSGLSSWPAKFPSYAGAMLSGYNALLDIILRGVSLVTTIPAIFLYFKVMPILWFGSMIWVWSKFAQIYSKNKWYLSSLLFFIFFGNSLSYLFRYFHEGTIWGASGILSMQSPQMLTNIQFALTLPLLGLLLILFKKEKLNFVDLGWLAILNFAMMGLKFYGGVVGIIMSVVFAMTLAYKKNWKMAIMTGGLALSGFALATLLFYNPFSATSGEAILSLRPMATIHPIIEEIGLFYAPGIANLRNNLYASGVEWRLVLIELFTLGLFVIFNWGTRIVGVLSIKRKPFDVILLAGIVAGLALNTLLIQRGEWWNTVQFLYYATFLSSIFAAETVAKWIEKGKFALVPLAFTLLLTIPNAFDTYRIFSSFPPRSFVSDQEIEALNHLKDLPPGVVLALPSGSVVSQDNRLPSPLYRRYDTAYVAGFSGKTTYLNDLVQLRLTGIEHSARVEAVAKYDCGVLTQVQYIYMAGDESQIVPWKKCDNFELRPRYQNEEVTIFEISQQ